MGRVLAKDTSMMPAIKNNILRNTYDYDAYPETRLLRLLRHFVVY